MCKDKQYCVKVAYVMDGSRDCPDGSDEGKHSIDRINSNSNLSTFDKCLDPVFVDECALNKHNCSPNGMCLKIPGEEISRLLLTFQQSLINHYQLR